ncbi:chemotaxis protein (plasmid) [Vibrio sp. qd031]|uniref:chemotaxis protein n=1 Tax=Vibrio sp. qd031 TaxID=1603038 RepID=UPI000A104D92|nr:chemotaxis protein [Vibrio sp. qd031]ORT52518.1 chemotaxis protein [Vibrio sp. qd031]
MGGKSSSSSNTTATNTTGQNAIEGDNNGVALSGINDSTVNVTATDHGAVKGALELGGELISEVGNIHDKNIDFASDVTKQTTDFAAGAIANNTEFAGSVLEEFSSSNSENLNMLAGLSGSQAAQNSANLDAVMELAKFQNDGGETENNKTQLIAIVVLGLVVGAVAFKAVSK